MQVIWKYPLSLAETQIVRMPMGGTILSIQAQGPQACLWALVDPLEARVGHRLIRCLGTGHKVEGVDLTKFLATVQQEPYVWHFFDGGWK